MNLEDSGHSEEWDRGWLEAYQDDCENCQFSGIGGKDHRTDMVAPDYIPSDEVEEFLAGYSEYCLKKWGDDWKTFTLGWVPVLTINEKEPPRVFEGQRYYLDPSEAMEMKASVTPIRPAMDNIRQTGHLVSVRLVKNGEWFKANVEGDLHETFPVACSLAEKRLMSERSMVAAEGHHYADKDCDIYLLRRA
jgi:hypothetical protein